MTFKLGDTSINKLFLGATEIKRAYLGATEIFDSTGGGGGGDPDTLFGSLTPITGANTEDSAYNLGTVMTFSAAGQITHVRLYEPAGNSKATSVRVWNGSGTHIASKLITHRGTAGWNEVLLDTPISVSASSTFTVGYTYYGWEGMTDSYHSGSLHTTARTSAGGYISTAIGAGRYGSLSGINDTTLPTSVYQNEGYYADCIFVPD